jgi:hypothetical protein
MSKLNALLNELWGHGEQLEDGIAGADLLEGQTMHPYTKKPRGGWGAAKGIIRALEGYDSIEDYLYRIRAFSAKVAKAWPTKSGALMSKFEAYEGPVSDHLKEARKHMRLAIRAMVVLEEWAAKNAAENRKYTGL